MQNELALDHPTLDISILGINEVGYEAGNSSITNGRDLPWLQDTVDWNVWGTWAPTYRDVIVLDGNNEVYTVFNLTSNTLATPANYDALKQIFLDAAGTL